MALLFAVVLSVAVELVVTTQLNMQSTSTKAAAAAAEGESTLFFSGGRVVIWGNDGCHGGCNIIGFLFEFCDFPPQKTILYLTVPMVPHPIEALFNGGFEIGVSEFWGAISFKIMGFEPCESF